MSQRCQFLSLRVLMLTALFVCFQRNANGQLPCGQVAGCGCSASPLIIFIGADRDIARAGRVHEVVEDFRACGYNAVYFDPWKQLHDDEAVACMIRHAVRCNGRRVMLVGWSYGAVVGLKALQIVAREGICVDTFVELDCFNLNFHMGDRVQPTNVGRVVVLRTQLNKPVREYCRAEVHRLDSCWHLGAPTHPRTQCVLKSEMNRLAVVEYPSH